MMKSILDEKNKEGFQKFLNEYNILEKDVVIGIKENAKKDSIAEKRMKEKSVEEYLLYLISSGFFADFYFQSPIYEGSGDSFIKQSEKQGEFETIIDGVARSWSKRIAQKSGLYNLSVLENPDEELFQEYAVNIRKYKVFGKPHKDIISYCHKIMENKASEVFCEAMNYSEEEKQNYKRIKKLERAGEYEKGEKLRFTELRKPSLSLDKENETGEDESKSLLEMIKDERALNQETRNTIFDLNKEIKNLSREDKRILKLWIRKNPNKEIAKEMGKTKGAIEVKIHRIIKNLKKKLEM